MNAVAYMMQPCAKLELISCRRMHKKTALFGQRAVKSLADNVDEIVQVSDITSVD